MFNLLGGEPEYLDPLKDEAPVGWWVTGYPWYAIGTPEHKRFLDAYQAKCKDYPRLGSVVGYSDDHRRRRRDPQGGLDRSREDRRRARQTSASNRRSARSPSAPLDHQSTMGAYVGRTAVKDGKGVMVDWRYADGKDYLPSDDAVKRMRPAD